MKYTVWMEGFHAQGSGPVGAMYLGEFEGETFKDACRSAALAKLSEVDHFYNGEFNTYYGCHFFESGDEAVKSFG